MSAAGRRGHDVSSRRETTSNCSHSWVGFCIKRSAQLGTRPQDLLDTWKVMYLLVHIEC